MWGRLQLKLSCCEIFIVGGSKSSFFKLLLDIGMASQTKLVWEGKEAMAVWAGDLGSGREDKLSGVKVGWAGGQPGCAATTSASSASCQGWLQNQCSTSQGSMLARGNFQLPVLDLPF